MAAESNLEVGVPTDQPLICTEGESEQIEIECFSDDKKCDSLPDTKKVEAESKFISTSHIHRNQGVVSVNSVCNDNKNSDRNDNKNADRSDNENIDRSDNKNADRSDNKNIDRSDNKLTTADCSMAKSQSEIQVCVTNSLSVSQTSKNSLMTFSSSGTFYDHSAAKKKVDLRISPKRAPQPNGKDTTDFRQMEQGLLQLLEDFHSGKLEAFGQGCTFERMESVREQQERLARLHFDLNAQQELCGQHTEEGIKMAKNNLLKLTENLQQLSLSIEQLQQSSNLTGE